MKRSSWIMQVGLTEGRPRDLTRKAMGQLEPGAVALARKMQGGAASRQIQGMQC